MSNLRLEQLFSFLQEDSYDSFLLFAIAKEYESLGDLEHAKEYYLKILSNDPDYVGMYYHLAKLYEKLEENAKAIEMYDAGLKIGTKLADFHAVAELNNAKVNLEMEL